MPKIRKKGAKYRLAGSPVLRCMGTEFKKKQNYFKGYLRFHSEIDTPNRETQRIQYEIPDGKTVYAVCAQDMGIHVQYPQKCNFNDL